MPSSRPMRLLGSKRLTRTGRRAQSLISTADGKVPERKRKTRRPQRQWEVMEEDKAATPRRTVVQALEDRWCRTRDHIQAYPYVWASYIFVFGGLGIYSSYRWRALRKAEDELLRFQDKLKLKMTPEEIIRAMEEAESGKHS